MAFIYSCSHHLAVQWHSGDVTAVSMNGSTCSLHPARCPPGPRGQCASARTAAWLSWWARSQRPSCNVGSLNRNERRLFSQEHLWCKIHPLKQSWTAAVAELTGGAGVLSVHKVGPPTLLSGGGNLPWNPGRVQCGAFPLWPMLPDHCSFLLCQGSGPVKDYIRVKSCLSKGNVSNAGGCHTSMTQI